MQHLSASDQIETHGIFAMEECLCREVLASTISFEQLVYERIKYSSQL